MKNERGLMKSTTTAEAIARQTATLLKPRGPEQLRWEIQRIQLAITRRAYEIFENRNREHGHDWEDWFRAESELLRPISVAIAETPDCLSIRANVLGFSAEEVQIGIEPKRIAIVGTKKAPLAPEGPKSASGDFTPEWMLKLMELPSEIDPAGAIVEFQTGVLKFELPKMAKNRARTAGAGKG